MGNSLWLGVQYPFEGYSAEKLLFIMRLPEYRQYIKVQAELKKNCRTAYSFRTYMLHKQASAQKETDRADRQKDFQNFG